MNADYTPMNADSPPSVLENCARHDQGIGQSPRRHHLEISAAIGVGLSAAIGVLPCASREWRATKRAPAAPLEVKTEKLSRGG
jgi:hypothetical protein